jgi:hypothetical protein
MKQKLLIVLIIILCFTVLKAQTISIVGTGVNGWPPTTGPEITLSTVDNITYKISNLRITTGLVKFRQDGGWTNSWGGSTFPSGQGIFDGPNIPTVAGTYDVTFNRINATYTFITSTGFPSIGIWGPAVNSQLGFGGADIDMTTTDGIIYTLSGFYFSSGNAYFRQDNASNFVWGSVPFPTGTAVLGGPTITVGGGEWFVTFNRLTGEYRFVYPSIGILGTALNGFNAVDIDLTTTNGFDYSINGLTLANGEVKFRKDNLWTSNWGSIGFPIGIGTQDGANIPVTAGTYNVTFEKSSGKYSFITTLSSQTNSFLPLKIYPNPANSQIRFSQEIKTLEVFDSAGKKVKSFNNTNTNYDVSTLEKGVYILKGTTTDGKSINEKLVKE